ncbi:MAG: hypothetical protein IPK82_13610 [Polyangiaceae bacterium]|nr:hypothetical protein [Polyangiaceae bacterium]
MAAARYEPEGDVTFDLKHGLVHLGGAPARVLVPADALSLLCETAGKEATSAFGKAIGRAMGLRVAARLAEGRDADEVRAAVHRASVESLVDQLGGDFSIAGLGSIGIERWGHALVIVLDHCPMEQRGDGLIEVILSEAVTTLAARQTHAVLLERQSTRARFLLTNEAAAERVRAWLTSGSSWGDALARLHAPQPS